jgi:hypothetical protein
LRNLYPEIFESDFLVLELSDLLEIEFLDEQDDLD